MKKKFSIEKISQPELSDEQLQILSSNIETNDTRTTDEPFDKSTKATIIRYAKNHKIASIIVLVAAISLLLVLALLLIFSVIQGLNRPNKENFTVRIGENKYTATYEDIVINDTMYIDMTKLSMLDEIQISGNATSRKYTLPNLQYMRFENESTIAIVDGAYINMNAKAIIESNNCLVPMDFAKKVFVGGLTFEINTEDNEIKINRIKTGIDGDNNPVYEPINIFVIIVPLSNNIESDSTNVAYEPFGIDGLLNAKYIDPQKEEYLILVNHSHPMDKTYIPSDLVDVTCDTNPVNPKSYYTLRMTPEKALSLMMTAMKNSGISGVQVSSAYRSYVRQEYLLENYIESKMSQYNLSYEKARKEVLKTLAIPGHSEHQTGLSIDFVQGTSSLTTKFEDTTAFEWLSENAHKFGFILRYPSSKVSITGYDYEPWHYRFVGRTVASRIYEAGICYEEYVALTS